LDEIGDMPLDLQTRLLRVLSDGHYYRVGGHQPLKANVRVIAATHQDLEARVHSGQFREDLFHRLNVIRLRLPPLRERKEDIPILTKHFLLKSAQDLKVEPKQLSPAAMEVLMRLPFPGNVRQLENLCHWMTVMAPSHVVQVSDLPAELRSAALPSSSETIQPGTDALLPQEAIAPAAEAAAAPSSRWQDLLREEVDRALLQKDGAPAEGRMAHWSKEFEAAVLGIALRHTRGRRMEAAQLLGIGRNTITRKIAELHLEDDR
jgi:two-component system nitrogen regulation response regulator GlnG